MKTLEQRFWSHVEPTGFCWTWTGAKNPKGYGVFNRGGVSSMSHRVAYEYLVGVIPEGMVIDHLCRQTSCVNPDHLEPVTQKINLSRAYRNPEKFGLAQKRKTHCKRNHPYDEENTYRHGGRRHCRQCRKDAKTNV